jgi:D-alanyl-D-alanine carboxypeptidase
VTFFTAGLQPPMAKPSELLAAGPAAVDPVIVYTGPKKTGPALIAAVATDAEKQATPRRGKKSRVAAKKPDAASPKTEAKSDAKSDTKPGAKPAAVRHASVKPDAAAKPAEKPAASAAKPVKPKAAAKPKSETKPAG